MRPSVRSARAWPSLRRSRSRSISSAPSTRLVARSARRCELRPPVAFFLGAPSRPRPPRFAGPDFAAPGRRLPRSTASPAARRTGPSSTHRSLPACSPSAGRDRSRALGAESTSKVRRLPLIGGRGPRSGRSPSRSSRRGARPRSPSARRGPPRGSPLRCGRPRPSPRAPPRDAPPADDPSLRVRLPGRGLRSSPARRARSERGRPWPAGRRSPDPARRPGRSSSSGREGIRTSVPGRLRRPRRASTRTENGEGPPRCGGPSRNRR